MAERKLYSHYRPHKRVQEGGYMVHPHTGEVTRPGTMTKQEFKRECDINTILKHFQKTGMLNHVSARAAQGVYEDLPDPMEFQDALAIVRDSSEAFGALPSKLRARFDNDPAQFLAFCADPANSEEMKSLGLVKPPAPEPPPVRVEVVGGAGGTPPAEGA